MKNEPQEFCDETTICLCVCMCVLVPTLLK